MNWLKPQGKGKSKVNSWLPVAERNAGAELRLYCFPYAGAGAIVYRGWAERFPNERLQKAQRQAGQGFVSRTTLDTTCYGNELPIVALVID